jgi:hypothetical protein
MPAAQSLPPGYFLDEPKFKTVFLGTIANHGKLHVTETFKGEARGWVEASYSDPSFVGCGTKPFDIGSNVLVVMVSDADALLWHLQPDDAYVEKLRAAKRARQSNNRLLLDAYAIALRARFSAPKPER